MNKFLTHTSDTLDTYDAEIIEDIPEQFDLSRYKSKSNNNTTKSITEQYNHNHKPTSSSSTLLHDPTTNDYYKQNKQPIKSQLDSNSQAQFTNQQQQQQYYPPYTYQYNTNNTPTSQPRYLTSSQDYTQQQQQQQQINYDTSSSKKKSSKYPPPSPQDYTRYTSQTNSSSSSSSGTNPTGSVPWTTRARSDERKKNSFDEDNEENEYTNEHTSSKKEYFLKGGDDVPTTKKWLINRENLTDNHSSSYHNKKSMLKSDAYSRSDSGSIHFGSNVIVSSTPAAAVHTSSGLHVDHPTMPKSIKPAIKKHGVTFDEKLEVYEVKNPHYGLEVKSEKREQKKKKKDRQKEEETWIKTKFDMKSRIQQQNMNLYYFYEKTLIYNALVYYEEKYYRNSIMKLQDKLKSSKTDEKLKEHFLQIIERENQTTVDIIKSIQRDYYSKLEPFCNQFQTTIEKLHTFPGMYQIIQQTAGSVQYSEIVSVYVSKEQNSSPSTLRKILGHDGSNSSGNSSSRHHHSHLMSTIHHHHPIKPPNTNQRKNNEPWIHKNVLAAIDMHVREISYSSYKTLTDFIYKLNEVCENDLHRARAIFKYILLTQLELLRRNETGFLLMQNYDAAIESTNTIFARLCSFAGIENHCIRGLWKTICSEPGEKVESKCLWNVLYIENGWRFVQPSFTPVKYYNKSEIKYEETEYYFLSEADTLYYEFLPQEKVWQFTDSFISVKEFEKRPILTPTFRNLNLSIIPLITNLSNNLEKEPFKLTIRYPKEYSDSIQFKYFLKPINNNSILNYTIPSNSLNDNLSYSEHLNLFVIAELISKENAILFKISSLPQVGNYSFTVFAGLVDDFLLENSSSLDLNNNSNNNELKAVTCIRLNCSKVGHFDTPPNRINPNEITVFGMNNIMKRLGLNCPDFKQGVLGTDREGKVNLVFEMSQPLDIEAYLYSFDPSISSRYLELCILKRVVHNFLILIINPPHAGLYGLDLHGSSKGSYSTSLQQHSLLPPIGKYLIKCHTQLRSFTQFPKGDNRDWGPKQKFYDLGLLTRGYMDPYILNEDGKQIEIEIGMLNPVTMWFKLFHDQNGTPREISNFCFMNYKSLNKQGHKTVSFLLRFPFRGFYHLALMATNESVVKPDEIVYNYLIRVQDPPNDVESFPIVVNPILWRDCCLIAPKNYRMNSYDVHFSIIVPKTSQVLVSTMDHIVEKLESREIENSWVGLVSLNESSNSRFIFIEAEFNHKYTKLVKFKGLGEIANNEQY